MRQGAPRGDIHDGESGGVPGLHARALRFDHLAVRFSATVVFVHRRRQAEPAREKARRGVDADDLFFIVEGMGSESLGALRCVVVTIRNRSRCTPRDSFRRHQHSHGFHLVRWFEAAQKADGLTGAQGGRKTHRVFGGADGPVRLDAHVALDGDSLWID